MNTRLAERELATKFGTFLEVLYTDGGSEAIALVLGTVDGGEDVLVRIHSACLGGHVFNSIECECAAEMAAAQAAIQKAGRGVIIYLDQEGKGNGHLALMKSVPFKQAGLSQAEAYEKAGYAPDARDYSPAADILSNLGVRSIVMLSRNPGKARDLSDLGIRVGSTLDIFS
ncbi:MAG: GTP cyclohydrolase [Acidobacteria bacterium]|nr:GTP cyclohydrolase [Acidobacteriota bacterium]